MVSTEQKISLSSPDDTARLAFEFSKILGAGDTLLLEGPIGAGKSHFCRSLILALLSEYEDVPSPTFTIVQTYEGCEFPIWHCDLYRLTQPEEAWELGLEEAFENALCLIEWPDRLGTDTPDDALCLSFSPAGEESRTVTFSYKVEKWTKRLEGIHA